MDFRDSLSTDLPAPRDDEPAGLRQDILDELGDHLACSYNRELLRGADSGEARRRAIERFGDPAAVARRLWLDAMRGKIMAQRVLVATCLVVVAACFGLVGLVWSQSNRAAAEVAEANRRLTEVLGQTQATNQEMLRQLQAMAKPAQPSKSVDWIPISFKLTVEKPDGPPAVGYEVILGRGHGGTMKGEPIHRSSGADGVADFGVVRPGDWEFAVRAGPWHTTGGLNAIPGTSVLKEIVCPKSPPDRAQVKVRVDWPEPLAEKDLVAVATFQLEDRTYQPPLAWSTNNGFAMGGSQSNAIRFLVRPRGGIALVDDGLSLTVKDLDPNELPFNNVFSGAYLDQLRARGKIHGVLPLDSSGLEGPPEVLAGRYSLTGLALLRSLTGPAGARPGECKLLTLMDASGIQIPVSIEGRQVIAFLRGHRMKRSSRKPSDHFEALPGQTAEWVISLPDEMIREAEKELNAKPPAGKAG